MTLDAQISQRGKIKMLCNLLILLAFYVVADCVGHLLAQSCKTQAWLEVDTTEEHEAVLHVSIQAVQFSKI